MLKHVQEFFYLFIYFFFAAVKKYIYIVYTSYWSAVNIITIKHQLDFLHHQEEKASKRLVEVDRPPQDCWVVTRVKNLFA